MRILLVNKFHWLKGGSETYYFGLGKILKEHGHEVAYFSMKDERNVETGDKEYFVEKSDMNSKNITKALSIIYNKKNKKKMEEALDDFKPDIVHLNNFQRQLSSSIIDPCIERNIPIVYTAHDVQAICPAILMLDSNGNICEDCLHHKYNNCIKKKCIKNSKLKSILGAYENKFYYKNKIYTDKINYIIIPSEFYRNKFIEDGFSKNKVVCIHNFIDTKGYDIKTQDEGYALYFGRLSREKGILNLINAFKKLDKGVLYIAGDGPEKETIKKIIKENKLEKRVKLLGLLTRKQMTEATRKCKFVVVPSTWYENCPYSVLETMAIGKPIIGSNIGGIPELIRNKETGFIYKSDNIDELSDRMKTLFENDRLVKEYSKKAKELAKKEYSTENYYKKLMNIYNKVREK